MFDGQVEIKASKGRRGAPAPASRNRAQMVSVMRLRLSAINRSLTVRLGNKSRGIIIGFPSRAHQEAVNYWAKTLLPRRVLSGLPCGKRPHSDLFYNFSASGLCTFHYRNQPRAAATAARPAS
jgi:hypothetical protein